MIRKLLIGISAAALVAVLVPASPAHSQTPSDSIAVVFTAGAEVCPGGFDATTGSCPSDPDGILAPVAPPSPDCGANLCPGRDSDYRFTTGLPGAGGLVLCIGVGNGAPGFNIDNQASAGNCELSSEGIVRDGILPTEPTLQDGPWCGWSSGSGNTGGNVGNVDVDNFDVRVEWQQSAGTVLPLEYYDNSNNELVGHGAVQTTGASGPCGLSGDSGARFFAVTGYSTAAA